MSNSIFIYFPLVSVLLSISTAYLLFRVLRSRTGRDVAFFLIVSAGWSFFIFIELYFENNIINILLLNQQNYLIGIPVFLQNKEVVFNIIKYASTLAGFFAMFIPVALMRISLNFPPRQLTLTGDRILLLLALLMGSPSYFGMQFTLTDTGIIRSPSSVILIQLVYVILFCFTSQIILFLKSKDFSSPLRRLEARYIPQAFLVSILIGGGFGYLAAYIPETTPVLIIATSAPMWFTLIIISGLVFSRKVLGQNINYAKYQGALHVLPEIKQKIGYFINIDIHLSIFQLESDFTYRSVIDDEILTLPESLFNLSKNVPCKIAYIEDFDDQPGSIRHRFMTSQYTQAVCLKEDKLILVHRIKNNKIINQNDLKFFDKELTFT